MTNGMTLTARQATVVLAVLDEMMMRPDVHYFLGSETIKEAVNLASRLRYNDYCIKHGIKFEDLTEADCEREYLERYDG